MKRLTLVGLAGFLAVTAGCHGSISGQGGGSGASSGGGGDQGGGTGGTGGTITPFETISTRAAVGKVKNLLTGMPPTDQDVATVTANGVTGLQSLIDAWTTAPEFKDLYRQKMLAFFRNAF